MTTPRLLCHVRPTEYVNNIADVDFVERVSIDDVKPAPENETVYHGFDCRHADDNALYVSVKEHGVLEPLTVSADGYILSGHRRHWASVLAGLVHVPIRRVGTRLSDLQPAARLRVLTEHNTQRNKGAEEQAREALVRASPEDAFRLLRERLASRQAAAFDLLPSAMRIEGRTARAEISDMKTGFLDAICREVNAREAYWPLSVRQLHYAMLNDPPLRHASKPDSRYRNDRESYRALCDLCARARLCGKIPWAALADETRPVELWQCNATVAEYVEQEAPHVLGFYRRDLMQGQLRHVEVVCEKNTVADLVRRVANEYCIPVTSGRGYCSLEPRRQIAERHAASRKSGCTLVLVSDCDPDGDEIAVSLARSLRDDFGLWNVAAVRAALTPEQARSFGLQPNTDAKASSPQFKKFVARHGARNAYELEALSPEDLSGIVREAIESVIDMDAYRQELETWTAEAAELEVIRQRVTAPVMAKPCG